MFGLDNDIVCGLEKVTAALAIPLEMLQVAVEQLPSIACRPRELLQAHAAQVFSTDVKLLEGDAAGVQLVGVQEVLQPFPHLIFGPVLRVDFMPLASKKATGNIACGVAVRPGWLLVEKVVGWVEIHYTTSFQNHDLIYLKILDGQSYGSMDGGEGRQLPHQLLPGWGATALSRLSSHQSEDKCI